MAATKYIVRNPRNLPPGTFLISWDVKTEVEVEDPDTGEVTMEPRVDRVDWYEGDEFIPYPEMKFDRLLRDGFIEEA